MTYSRNIARLKESGRANLREGNAERLRTAEQRGRTAIEEANDVATKLSGFSKHLQEWKQEDIKIKEYEGLQEARRVEEERAKTIGSHAQKIKAIEDAREQQKLAEGFEDAEAEEYAYQEMKAEILRLQGVDAYPDADRIAKLSPHQQVGYVKEKLRQAKQKYSSQLEYTMANSETPITIEGVTYTPKQLRDKNIQALPFKEAAVNVSAAQLRKSLGLDKYSPAMLKLSGMDETIQKAKDSLMAKYRKRYNIDSSMQTQEQAKVDYLNGPKGPKQAARFLLTYSNTVNKNNQINGNGPALDALFSMWKSEGINNSGNTDKVDEYAKMPLPEPLRKKLGAKPGTTYGDQWGPRFAKLRTDIAAGYVSAVNAEKDRLKADVTALGNQLLKDQRDGKPVDAKKLQKYKMLMTMLGVKDDRIENFMTIEDRLESNDTERIEDRIAEQHGYITNAQLDEYNSKAALPFREKADKWEKAHKTEHRVDQRIKGALNESWADAGIKTKEKPVVWEEALYRATQDYERKFNRLVAIGYPPKQATELALNGAKGEPKNEEGGQLTDFEGVVTEIERMGARSRYTREGEEAKANLKDAHIRVDKINRGKEEMLRQPDIFEKEIIGGTYGQEQLNVIAENIKNYGPTKGLRMSETQMKFYRGLARGKRKLSAHGIIDAQLKLIGHPGLYPEREKIEEPDPNGTQAAVDDATQATKYEGSGEAYVKLANNQYDLAHPNEESIYNQSFMIPDYLGGTYV